jgi:hypothetical protein
MKNKLSLLILLALLFISCKENKSGLIIHDLYRQNLNEDLIYFRGENKLIRNEIKNLAINNPEKYASIFVQSEEFHDKTSSFIIDFQNIEYEISNVVMSNSTPVIVDHAEKIMFENDTLSNIGKNYKTAIERYIISIEDQLFFYPKTEQQASVKFNIKPITNREGLEIDYFEYHFKNITTHELMIILNQYEKNALMVEHAFNHELIYSQ